MGLKKVGLSIVGFLFILLIGFESVDLVGKGMEDDTDYEVITVDDVILKGLDNEGLTGLYSFVENYGDLSKVTLGKDIGDTEYFQKKYINDSNIRVKDDLCDFYYTEGFNLMECNGLEEVLIKLDTNQLKRMYELENESESEPVTEDKEFTYKGVTYSVKYLISGEDKYLMNLKLTV